MDIDRLKCSSVGIDSVEISKKTSIDEELSQAAFNLTVGPSSITSLSDASFVMPPMNKLHPNLYNNSLRDISMDAKASSADATPSKGVPGFPDFPDMWMGESSHKQPKHRRQKKSACKKSPKKRLVRKAVNTPFGSSSVSATTKAMKIRARSERKLHRLEKCLKLKAKRGRKKDMGELCKGMAGMFK